MDITFVLSHIPDPRTNKRIESLKKVGSVSVVCWNRMNSKIWEAKDFSVKNIEIKIKTEYEQPLKRLFQTWKFILVAKKQLKSLNPKCLYVGNVDMLLLAYIHNFGRKNKAAIFYEVADLNSLIIDKQKGMKRVIQGLIKYGEKKMCKKVDTLIITSERFYNVYYKDFFIGSKVVFIPNMPEPEPFTQYKRKEKGNFTVGYIGYIRYENQLKMLIDAAEKSNIKAFMAGTGIDSEIEEYCKGKTNVQYFGQYNYDAEIANLYGQVDCVYAVYDASLMNVRVALPNKLYEAIYCGLPIIVADGTYLAELVVDMGVGVTVSHTDQKDLINLLKKLSQDKEYYQSLVDNCKKAKGDINASSYHEKLINRILQWM